MKRIDKIYQYVLTYTTTLRKDELLASRGLETQEIADGLAMLRNNVSKELNELFRLDKLIKLKGRPVCFLAKAGVEEILSLKLPQHCLEVEQLSDVLEQHASTDPFCYLIGANQSLRNQVEQAKAAIMYPPVGLHTLILGNTGVGKTLFAKMMYNYGKYTKRFAEQAPFVIFNCADYYNNPQLLLAHIFGHVKGAFTGADQEKDGLVAKADTGILFLDEIHRLPPEGQEMIFYFMDTGTYNKLGETERKRQASVLVIAATTEDPASSMLKTFVRRIPIIINIPSLQERSAQEKVEMIKYLFANEASRVNKPFKISAEVVKALIGSVSYGNIGQLKSNIQLACAKGFLHTLNSGREYIELDFKMLPPPIKDGLFEIGRTHQEFEALDSLLRAPLLIQADGHKFLLEDANELPFNLYTLIEDKISLLKDEGIDDAYINQFITTDVTIQIKKFYNRFNRNQETRERILKFIAQDVLEFAERMKSLAERSLARTYSERFVYALGFHLSAFFQRMKDGKYNYGNCRDHSIQIKEEELKVAKQIKEAISQTFHIDVPAVEVTYIAILLQSVEEERQGQVAVLVAAHGSSTASSMVDVVKKLLGSDVPLEAVDMPLDVSPKEILAVMTERVSSMQRGKGVLLLVDMGSLFKFEATLMERTGIPIKSIDMVSTPLVLEAVRKASVFAMGLDDMYRSLREFRGYNNEAVVRPEKLYEKVIVTICASGSGTAVKLKELVEEVIAGLTDEQIMIVPLGIRDMDKRLNELQKKQEVLAAVGVKKPRSSVPFIPLEKLIDGTGEAVLRDIIGGRQCTLLPQKSNMVVRDLCEKSLQQFLTFLNPAKIMTGLMDFADTLERRLNTQLNNSMKIRLLVHVGCALERMVMQEGLQYVEDAPDHAVFMEALDEACLIFSQSLKISLSVDEKHYICEMLALDTRR